MNDEDHSESDVADHSNSHYQPILTDEERAGIIALHERLKSDQSEPARIAWRKKVAELDAILKPIEAELYRFEKGELLRGNPAAIAGRPPVEWGLSPEAEALYDRQWEVASWLYYIEDCLD